MAKQQKWSQHLTATVAQDAPASSPASVESAENKVSEASPPPNVTKRVQPQAQMPPSGAPSIDPEAEFAAKMFELDQDLAGEPQRETKQGEKTTPQKQAPKEPTAEIPDPMEKELDEHEAAMAKAKLAPAKEEEPEPKAAEGDEEEPEGELEEPETSDPEYAKWLKSLSPPARKKIERQQKRINEQEKLLGDRFVIQPTLQDPLSNITSHQDLANAKAHYENMRDEVRKVQKALKEDEFTPLVVRLANGQERKFGSVEELDNEEAFALAALDDVPNKKTFLLERDQAKPWEKGFKLAPGLAEKDSRENKVISFILKKAPQIKTQIPEWEYYLGHMARSLKQEWDEVEGKRRHVSLELDAEGNVKAPKRVVTPKASTPKARPAPSTLRPPVSSGSRDEGIRAAMERVEKEPQSDEALLALVKAKLA